MKPHANDSRVPSKRRNRQRRGFSIVEMLIVISMIVILLTLLMAPLFEQAITASYRVSCASNLHQIHTAQVTWRAEHRSQRSALLQSAQEQIDAGNWAGMFEQYLQGNAQTGDGVYRCPEDSGPQANTIGEFEMHMTLGGSTLAYAAFDGPLVMKISNTQYLAAPPVERRRLAQLGDGDAWRSGGVYVEDDDPGHYWLLFEDIIDGNGNPTGDLDFEDVQVEVFENGASVTMHLWKGVTNRRNFLVLPQADGTKYDVLGGRELPSNRSNAIVLDYFFSVSSYGINQWFSRVTDPSKIMMTDFDDVVVDLDVPWSDYMLNDTTFTFARHAGMVNIARMDGSIATVDPFTIDPDTVTNRHTFWYED
jgi:prepilin-type N-terminal cleavage/methylation domain-containing protein